MNFFKSIWFCLFLCLVGNNINLSATVITLENTKIENYKLEQINLEKIKELTAEFESKETTKNWVKRAIVTTAILTTIGIITYECFLKGKSKTSSNESSPKTALNGCPGIHIPTTRDKVEDWVVYITLGSLTIPLGNCFDKGITESYNKISSWWGSKGFSPALFLQQCQQNISLMQNNFEGIINLQNDTAYSNFYLTRVIETHNALVGSIECLIASSFALSNNKNNKNWLLSDQNGLILEMESLRTFLDKILHQNPVSIDLIELKNHLNSLLLKIQRLNIDFRIAPENE
ncbi:TPA: hypothetical protein DEO28_04160 [Candidatus Dependentiae bacterium]|nr:MAG: hypothetical protein UR14_C0006G0069 [candidate division TM6 bacterium GW2011_GWE2_31_21]KKP53508.1 MAG: hypothetical protein UR43_C0004G0049 [candidate division TM6 bacterium GW2011_GWF2_33_332]HBS48251.1 hypothetical protein [Candidatus Dependentiae bacterium]HBZ73677.1 hypothetical protein [Candidatus Dependentiae bacterium]